MVKLLSGIQDSLTKKKGLILPEEVQPFDLCSVEPLLALVSDKLQVRYNGILRLPGAFQVLDFSGRDDWI